MAHDFCFHVFLRFADLKTLKPDTRQSKHPLFFKIAYILPPHRDGLYLSGEPRLGGLGYKFTLGVSSEWN